MSSGSLWETNITPTLVNNIATSMTYITAKIKVVHLKIRSILKPLSHELR